MQCAHHLIRHPRWQHISGYLDPDDVHRLILRLSAKGRNHNQDEDFIPWNETCLCEFASASRNGKRRIQRGCRVSRALGPRGKIGIPWIVECARERADYILKESLIRNPYARLRRGSGIIPRFASHRVDRWGVTDEFTNETIVGYILSHEFLHGKGTTAPVVEQFGAFVCRRKKDIVGYNLMEKADGDLNSWNTDALLPFTEVYAKKQRRLRNGALSHILGRIYTALDRLQRKYDYNHGDLKAGNVFLKVTRAGITPKLADYGKSSLTFHGTRFYTEKSRFEHLIPSAAALPRVQTSTSGRSYFLAPSNVTAVSLAVRHLPLVYPHAYDVYVLLVSMALDRTLFYSFFTTREGSDLWRAFWMSERDSAEMFRRVNDAQKTMSSSKRRSVTTAMAILARIRIPLAPFTAHVRGLLRMPKR